MLDNGSISEQLGDKAGYLLRYMQRLNEDLEGYKTRLAVKFESEAKLQEARSRKARIDEELEIDVDDTSAMALDKTD
jgi:hypothetical protein